VSNKIRINLKFEFLQGSTLYKQIPNRTYEVETTSDLAPISEQVVGTTHELVAAGDVADTALMIITNLHATATVSVGGDAAGSFVKWFDIAPGDPPAVLPRVGALASTYLKSSAASTIVGVTLVKIAS
jgi:hypothetical protein